MAIDMIENNELSALAPSRLGLRQFADDNWVYKNYTGDDQFFNLFGSRKAKISKYEGWAKDKFADLPTDCENIQKSIDIINNELASLLRQKPDLNVKTQIKETNLILTNYKKLQLQQDCEKKAQEAKATKEKEDTLSTLTQLSDVSVGKAQKELAGLQSSDGDSQDQTKKYLMYGGIGLGAILLIFLIARR